MADAAPHVVHPTIPVWAINLALSVLIAALWPIGWLLDQYMDPYFLRIIVLIGINVILATGLNLVNGITGQFSLGHAGFMAVGAYAVGSAMKHYAPSGATGEVMFLVLLIIGGLLAAFAVLVVAIAPIRLQLDDRPIVP